MKYLLFTIVALCLLSAPAAAQTIKSLGYNTTNGNVVYSGTNALTFTNAPVNFVQIGAVQGDLGILADNVLIEGAIEIVGTNASTNAALTRTNLGLGLPALTNDSNVTFRSAVGVAPAPIFKVLTNDFSITNQTNMTVVDGLTISTEAGKTYIFELFPIVSAATGGQVVQIVASNATIYGNWDNFGANSYTTNTLSNSFTVNTTAARSLVQKFYVTADTNAGSISFQFSSTVATNTNTIGAGSYMMAQEVVPTP